MVRGGSTGAPPPAAPAILEQEKRSPLQPQQQGRVQPEVVPVPVPVPAPAPPKPSIVKAPKHAKVNQKTLTSAVLELKQRYVGPTSVSGV
ncbi:unnamed protein product [Arctia plantaginis]|uniref:Uncharacterized protein n=1 Tax=Arctia plantaginis TaxID=874455 RepID=A0A8S1A963_ARCPL|nr:unnamed protein product [Arctia plantaginis]